MQRLLIWLWLVSQKDISIIFDYLRTHGGRSDRLINWTPELKAELDNSIYQPQRYWAGKITNDQKELLLQELDFKCSVKGTLKCVPVTFKDR